jgi:hypothetical protein
VELWRDGGYIGTVGDGTTSDVIKIGSVKISLNWHYLVKFKSRNSTLQTQLKFFGVS